MAWKWPWPKGREAMDVRPELKSARGSGFVAIHAQSEARWTRRDYAALAREGYMRNPVAHRCVRLISEASSAVPLLLYAGATEYDAHPALDLLARPNQRQAGGSFLEALYGNLLLAGNAYVELIETGSGLKELHLLRPDRVTILADAGGWPTALEYREGSTKRRIGLSGGGEGRALHLSLFHPLDDHYGFPPLEAALMALDTHNAAGQWNKALLDNSARPSGALVYAPKEGGNLTDEQFDRLKTELEEGYSGARRARAAAAARRRSRLEGDEPDAEGHGFHRGQEFRQPGYRLAFGVPPMLLGIPGDNTYANYQEANRAFYRLTVLPLDRPHREGVFRLARACFRRSFAALVRCGPDRRAVGRAGRVVGAALGPRGSLAKDEKREAVGYRPAGASDEQTGFQSMTDVLANHLAVGGQGRRRCRRLGRFTGLHPAARAARSSPPLRGRYRVRTGFWRNRGTEDRYRIWDRQDHRHFRTDADGIGGSEPQRVVGSRLPAARRRAGRMGTTCRMAAEEGKGNDER